YETRRFGKFLLARARTEIVSVLLTGQPDGRQKVVVAVALEREPWSLIRARITAASHDHYGVARVGVGDLHHAVIVERLNNVFAGGQVDVLSVERKRHI